MTWRILQAVTIVRSATHTMRQVSPKKSWNTNPSSRLHLNAPSGNPASLNRALYSFTVNERLMDWKPLSNANFITNGVCEVKASSLAFKFARSSAPIGSQSTTRSSVGPKFRIRGCTTEAPARHPNDRTKSLKMKACLPTRPTLRRKSTKTVSGKISWFTKVVVITSKLFGGSDNSTLDLNSNLKLGGTGPDDVATWTLNSLASMPKTVLF
mmetsp:Transcript_147574/g.474105  ORF Transcript_147574/g.474105 Transcript_147574/m.474105 type:complete len:211 (+) Transcript_147574:477-1109(+)